VPVGNDGECELKTAPLRPQRESCFDLFVFSFFSFSFLVHSALFMLCCILECDSQDRCPNCSQQDDKQSKVRRSRFGSISIAASSSSAAAVASAKKASATEEKSTGKGRCTSFHKIFSTPNHEHDSHNTQCIYHVATLSLSVYLSLEQIACPTTH
jgi:hypothetical protein